MSLVLDCSVALAWCFTEEQTERVVAIVERVSQESAHVPALWRYEVANGLLRAERRARLIANDRQVFLEALSGLNIVFDPLSDEMALTRTSELATRHMLTVYDASYLELAERRGLPLATNDDALKRAASSVGVALL